MNAMNIVLTAAAVVVMAGCQTRITAEKNAEILLPVYACNGTNVFVCGYERASGGWLATARSPLWANEQFAKLTASVSPDGVVGFGVDGYSRDLSTNAVAMTQVMVEGAVKLADRICTAVTAAGQAKASVKAAQSLAAQFVSKGGDVANATVECVDGSCSVSDGTVCVGGLCSE